MSEEAQATPSPFSESRTGFDTLVAQLQGAEAVGQTHAELEDMLDAAGRKLMRQLFQDHLDLRAMREQRLDAVIDAQGDPRGTVERGHQRTLTTRFGDVIVERLAYRRRGQANLHPADAHLNLPEDQYSHGVRKLAAIEASRGSFQDAVAAIQRATAAPEPDVHKRQVEQLVGRAAVDFDAFYANRERPSAEADNVLVLSADGKGIIMRHDALRPATAAAAERATTKLATRLSKGEKSHRKRMAEVGAVYDAAPAPRTPEDILGVRKDPTAQRAPAPTAKGKWLTASVTWDAATVVGQVFDEAQRRDPEHRRTWVALVDGNNHQIDRIQAEAQQRDVTVSVVVDFIHVLEYLWQAAWCFFPEGSPDAEAWVRERGLAVLAGRVASTASAIRRKATCLGLSPNHRKAADVCADYLTHKAPYLDYHTALDRGWPIATGVIEGACRHLVKDRMDLTGARWGLASAEAVLKLRALQSNGDFEHYWHYHLAQERRRVHEQRYANGAIPAAA